MDRRLWQDHLIMCSKLIVARAKLYTNGVIAGARVGLLDVEDESHLVERDGAMMQSAYARPLSYHEHDVTQMNVSLLKSELKDMSNDRDVLRDELAKVQSKLDAHKQQTMTSSDATLSDDKQQSSRDYDWLKSQCDWAMSELQSLRTDHQDTVRKCEQAVKEADLHRHNYKMVRDKLEQQQTETLLLKSQASELLADKQRLQQEVGDLQKMHDEDKREMAELRQKQRQAMNESSFGSSEWIDMFDTAVGKYEAAKQDYDTMRKMYADATSRLSASTSKVELLEEENSRIQAQYDEVVTERNSALKERKVLQQHVTMTIQTANRDKSQLLKELHVIKAERDDAKRKMSKAFAENAQTAKDIGRLRVERDAVVHEYTLVMSERDSVHKEIEQLQDRLSQQKQKLDAREKECEAAVQEATSVQLELTTAKRERDVACKQVKELKEKLGSVDADHYREDVMEGLDRVLRDHDLRMDHESCGETRYDRPARDSLDLESSRKEMEGLQADLSEALQEVEMAKQRRDWAFSERDKIVRERESMRTLCDKLRHERDNAVSKLAEALRDCDELKKQKSATVRELKEVKEKYESLVEKESRKSQLNSVGHNHSHDSAIDADLQEWELETLHFEIDWVNVDDFGFDLVGGKDDPRYPNDNAIFVSNVDENSWAFGKLRVNDHVILVNNMEVTNVDKRTVLQAMKGSGGHINMVVRRRKPVSTRAVHPVHISLTSDTEPGIGIEQGLYVSHIVQGSAAAKEGTLAVGDRILSVNGQSVERVGVMDVMKLIQSSIDHVTLNVLKYCPTPQPSLMLSSSASSGHNLTESSPDATSISPRSPRFRAWGNSPPPLSAPKVVSAPLKSSGSQTDSLDSPVTSARHQGGDKGGIFDRAIKRIVKPFHSGERDEREMRRKSSGYTMAMMSSAYDTPEEDERVDERVDGVNAIIKQCVKLHPSNNNNKPTKEKRPRRTRQLEHGTWPKCRPHVDYTVGGMVIPPFNPKKSRPSLSVVTQTNGGFATDSSATSTHKLPPTPPERTDSFKRGASIKHSPQSSDSTVKYMHMTSGSSGANSSASSPSKPPTKGLTLLDTQLRTVDAAANHTGFEKAISSSSHYSSGMTQHESKTQSPDYTVRSANQELSRYIQHHPQQPEPQPQPQPHRRPPWPSAAPPHTAKERRSAVPLSHGSRSRPEYSATKPTSLDIQPIYSPRPLPHSGQNITPSHPVAPPFSPPASHVSSAYQSPVSKPVHMSSQNQSTAHVTRPMPTIASQSHHASGRDRLTAFTPHTASRHSYPVGSPAQSQVLRSTNPVFQVVSSQVVSSVGSGHHTSQPCSRDGVMSPRYNTPPAYAPPPRPGASGRHTSVPEMNPDHLPHRLRNDRYSSPSPSPSQQSSTNTDHLMSHDEFSYLPHEGCATLPNRRIRIPSSQSVLSSKSSTGRTSTSSFDKVSERSSPISPFLPLPKDYHHMPPGTSHSLPPGTTHCLLPGTTHSLPQSNAKRKRPEVGETRNIRVEKCTEEPLGIQIESGSNCGIFVSSVSDNSLANKAGIQIGDQLLEVCGINMRKATYELAANVLRQCGGSVNMLVQYNPNKYREEDNDTSSETDTSSSSTCSTPDLRRGHPSRVSNDTITPDPIHGSTHSRKMSEDGYNPCKPRFVMMKKCHPRDDLGVTLIGGNAVGIFVHSIHPNTVASSAKGLRCGDHILEFNGMNFRTVTAEQAAVEMAKPTENVSILAQFNVGKYKKIKDLPGDSIYVRALFDRDAENEDELSFKKDDILYVDNTLYNGILGVWRAWLIADDGNKSECGTIPSKSRLEDECALKRSVSEPLDDELKSSRRGQGSARRSFFRRRRHQRNNSMDSRELSSYSDVSINSDSLPYPEDGSAITFERVERLDGNVCRPVLILGPLADALINKITSESPDKYCRCETEIIKASLSTLEMGQNDGVFVDFKARCDGQYDCVTVQNVKDIMDKNRHCMLDMNAAAISQMHKVHIYPIVLFIKHKSPKQIREVKDARFLPEKMSNKHAKELFDRNNEYENKYKRFFSDMIIGGNLAYMCYKIKCAIDNEQKKTVWVSTGAL